MEKTRFEKELSGFIGRLLREHFGRGPGNVICTAAGPYIITHISNFLSPMEKSLMANDKSVYVEKTRDLMMETLIKDISSYIEVNVNGQVEEFYYDWELKSKTGMIIAVLSCSEQECPLPSPNNYSNSELVHKDIISISTEAQKPPEETYSIMLNPRTLLIIRKGIFISIEKELLQCGFQENLKIAKRNLEKRLLYQHKTDFEQYLHAKLDDFFVDWNFEHDKSYILFNLVPQKQL
ncbi:DUF2294 domain-containing protein [Bacillus sp. AK031]